jgi:hypothetical protein
MKRFIIIAVLVLLLVGCQPQTVIVRETAVPVANTPETEYDRVIKWVDPENGNVCYYNRFGFDCIGANE